MATVKSFNFAAFLRGVLLGCILVLTAAGSRAGTLYLTPAVNENTFSSISGIAAISTTNGSYYNFGGTSPPGTPTGLAVDTNGYLYVAYGSANVIIRYTPAGQNVFTSACSNGPGPLCFDQTGNLYSANADGSISFINSSGSVSNYATLPSPASGLTIDTNGNLFALVGANTNIYKVSTSRSVSLFYSLAPYWILEGSDLAIDGQGNLLVGTAGWYFDPEIFTNQISEISPAEVFNEKILINDSVHMGPISMAGPVVDGSGNLYLASVGGNGSPNHDETVIFPTNGGSQYLSYLTCPVEGGLLAYSPYDVQLSDRPSIPIIIGQPQSQTNWIGSTVVLSVNAEVGTLFYQWYFNDTNANNPTNALAGDTNATLTLTDAQPAQSGTYTVLVSNLVGSVVSQPAQLAVLPGLEINMVPAIVLHGSVGLTYNLQYLDAVGMTNTNWATLATITITNTTENYPDYSAIGQAARYYRLVQVQ